jgi:two-component system response regulator RegA
MNGDKSLSAVAQINFLIIDDDVTFATTLARALSRRGFHVEQAHNATDALAMTTAVQPDKVILDLKLAKTSGLHLLKELKEIHPNLQVIILTGYSSVATAVEAIKLGALNYLCKPATVDEILATFGDISGNPEAEVAATVPSVERLEWEHIQKILQDNNGNISATARELGMHRRTLQRKLQKRPVKK